MRSLAWWFFHSGMCPQWLAPRMLGWAIGSSGKLIKNKV